MSYFITNESRQTDLKHRIEQLIQHACELKFLVGFFYFSGWAELVSALKLRPDLPIKILIGLDVDRYLDHVLEVALLSDNLSNAELTDRFFASLTCALNQESLDRADFYDQVSYFLDLLETGQLEIKKTLSPNHAKLYFFKADEHVKGWLKDGEVGKFITGSSNLTRAGIHDQQEFNVEIGDYGTVAAEKYFDDLWLTAVPITADDTSRQTLAAIIRNRTQVARITPFEAYVLVLKTYLDLMQQKDIHPYVARLLEEQGYIAYQYQLDAVRQALSVIEQYNGVIIADVVGLGKTVIACMVARDLGKRGMVICPPGLMGDVHYETGWRKYLADFELRKYEWDVFSSGDLENALAYLQEDGKDIEVIIVDEAHRFRNEDTQSYELLSAICRNRQVILLTATPFNNTPADIFAMLKLFIIPGRSSLTLDENLEGHFSRYNYDIRRLSFITRYYQSKGEKKKRAEKYYREIFSAPLPVNITLVKKRTIQIAAEIRAVLEPILIRRNRLDLVQDPIYSAEMIQLSKVEDPCELFFELTPDQLDFYDRVVNDYFGEDGRFKGAIYQPFMYEKKMDSNGERLDEEGNRIFVQQRNLFDFMRRLLVKRFESSFGSFARSISNFENIHAIVLDFIDQSGGKYVLDRQLIERIYKDDPEEIEVALQEFAEKLKRLKRVPKHERVYNIADFDQKDKFLSDIKSDLELMREINSELQKLHLVDNDSKAYRLIDQIIYILNEPCLDSEPVRRIVIFTEYVDTVKHLQPLLEQAFPGKVLTVSGTLTIGLSKDVLNNFDASIPLHKQRDEYQILLTSDKLSEGVNLNRAGAIINYDIPWNPTRVIQRVGRINRIGKKVFNSLYIYNFFPTQQGADIIKSREIASQKMFLIHTTLGEDAKIFDVDEAPAPAELYRRVNSNPEEEEEESLFTDIRQKYFQIQKSHPEIIEQISHYPARVKTAKSFDENQLVVFRRKGLGLFIQTVDDTLTDKVEVESALLEDGLSRIECRLEEPLLSLSPHFWSAYEAVKLYRDPVRATGNENSLEVKAFNNLNYALEKYKQELDSYIPFMRMLIKDLREYRTIPKFTLRRLVSVDLQENRPGILHDFIRELEEIRCYLGEDYLDIIQQRSVSMKTEIIIAVENIKRGK